jgi:hypothetical protein
MRRWARKTKWRSNFFSSSRVRLEEQRREVGAEVSDRS